MADQDLQIMGGGGGGHPDPEIRGASTTVYKATLVKYLLESVHHLLASKKVPLFELRDPKHHVQPAKINIKCKEKSDVDHLFLDLCSP